MREIDRLVDILIVLGIVWGSGQSKVYEGLAGCDTKILRSVSSLHIAEDLG